MRISQTIEVLHNLKDGPSKCPLVKRNGYLQVQEANERGYDSTKNKFLRENPGATWSTTIYNTDAPEAAERRKRPNERAVEMGTGVEPSLIIRVPSGAKQPAASNGLASGPTAAKKRKVELTPEAVREIHVPSLAELKESKAAKPRAQAK